MREVDRIAHLLEQSLNGAPYYGPSVLRALEPVTPALAARRPNRTRSIWELVVHVTAELNYARTIIEGTAVPWIAGKTTWPTITDTTESAWQRTIENLRRANRQLVLAVKQLEDSALDTTVVPIDVPLHVMLYGTLAHNAYHAGQISLLVRQFASRRVQH